MEYYNFPTNIIFGAGALDKISIFIDSFNCQRILLVTDQTLISLGLHQKIMAACEHASVSCSIFADVHPNSIEEQSESTESAVIRKHECICSELWH